MPDQAPRCYRLLILGGTAEAAAIARAALDGFPDRLEVVTSLAGRTERPGPLPGAVRIGGFGGPDGLERYLRDSAVDLLIDATHPFAEQISVHARAAAEAAVVPRLVFVRPAWRRHPLDRWIEVADMAGAASVLPRVGRRIMLTIGSGELTAFAKLAGLFFLVRTVDEPRFGHPFEDAELITGRGPFTVAGERHLFQRYRIDGLVTKASGGSAVEAKLVAAREAGLPVVMVQRPLPQPGERADSIEAVLLWLGRRIALKDRNLRTVDAGQSGA